MSSLGGPSIVTDGLVLLLDAGNSKSFGGEPTVNLVTYPQNILIGFVSANIYRNTGTTLNFNGVYNAGIISASSSSNYVAYVSPITGAITGSQYTTTWYLKADTAYIVNLNWGGVHRGNRTNFTLNLLDGSVTNVSVASGESYLVESSANGFYKISYSSTLQTGTIYYPQIGATTGTIIFGGIQIEKKSYATPFVNGTRGGTVDTGGGLIDRSGNGNNGSLVNNPTYNSLNGGSIVFDGVDDYVTIPSPTFNPVGNSSFSVSCWIKLNSLPLSNPRILSQGVDINNYFNLATYGGNSPGTYDAFWFEVKKGGVYYGGFLIAGLNKYVTNVWYNLVGTFDNNTNTPLFYVNSISRAGSGVGGGSPQPGPLLIANNNTTSPTIVPGNITIVSIYNRSLSAKEVLQNYNATKSRFGL